MSKHKNQTTIHASAEDIFQVFMKSIQNDFINFDEENAVGSKIKKTVGAYAAKSGEVEIEIKAFEKGKLYEIESRNPKQIFTSRYELNLIDENTTELIITETVQTHGIMGRLNDILIGFVFKKGIKQRFDHIINSLNTQLKEKVEMTTKNK